MEQTARFALDNGLHVVMEGIMAASRYRSMITGLIAAHRGRSHLFYLDVPFEETVARHATRPQASEFTPEQMREWYEPYDVLGLPAEIVVPASSTLQDTINLKVDVATHRAWSLSQAALGSLNRDDQG